MSGCKNVHRVLREYLIDKDSLDPKHVFWSRTVMREFASTVYNGRSLIISGGAEKVDGLFSNQVFKLDFKLNQKGKIDGDPEKTKLPVLGIRRRRHS